MNPVAVASAAILGAMLPVALWNLFKAPRLERQPFPASRRRVSLLVPARDEEVNLRAHLPRMLALEYPDLEILVLDDGSSDATAEIVRKAATAAEGRLRLLTGPPPPAGWLGKNWACHQLAVAADGEVLIFCDADVRVERDAVLRTVGAMESWGVDALTALPRQRLEGVAARSVVPMIAQLPVLALLPLPLVSRLRSPSLSMGNGQWIAFTRDAYEASGGHAEVRGEVVEDVELARRVKRSGKRLMVAVAMRTLEVRMYASSAALREGFGKNVYALAGGRPLPFALCLGIFTLTSIYPWAAVAIGSTAALPALALLLALRLCGAQFFHHGLWTLLLHPVGSLLTAAVAIESALNVSRGTASWKGRPLAPRGAETALAAADPVPPRS